VPSPERMQWCEALQLWHILSHAHLELNPLCQVMCLPDPDLKPRVHPNPGCSQQHLPKAIGRVEARHAYPQVRPEEKVPAVPIKFKF